MEEKTGLSRALKQGDAVILSSGANATVRRSYPAGYSGEVAILLDGAEEHEQADTLVLPDTASPVAPAGLGDPILAQSDTGENRAPSRRMGD